MTEYYRMPASNGDGIEILRYGDVHVIKGGDLDPKLGVEYLENFEYRPNDIFLCTFPKSGTHWMGNMIWKLKTLDESDLFDLPIVEIRQYDKYEQKEPRLMLTHLRPNHLPKRHLQSNGKIVLMLRNPKDVCVSAYYHLKNAKLANSGQTWDEFFQSFIKGNVPAGSYFEYLKEWDKLLYEKENGIISINLKVFYYESCMINQIENLTKLNDFLEFNRDKAYLEKVLEVTSFNSMKKEDFVNKEKINSFCTDRDGNSVIYRKGCVGDWKNHFTVAQSEMVDNILKEKLRYNIISFSYDSV